MTQHSRFHRHRPIVLLALLLALVAGAGACASKKDVLPTGITEVDKFLFEKGTEALDNKRWLTAREYFTRIVDNYPQSPFRPDAKLGVGDSYLGDGTGEGYVLAINEFKEFLTFYPTHRRADYAQYKLGVAHFVQMRGPERDQTETRAAIEEFEAFMERYPNSDLMPEVKAKHREARDRLSTSEYRVGYFYFRQRWYPGAIERFKDLLQEDPAFTSRDAVYYHLGEALLKVNLAAEALPYFDKLVKEFEVSEYLPEAKLRLEEFKGMTPPAATQPAATAPDAVTSPAPVPAAPAPTQATPPPPPGTP
jgi:outer membrane protein assembly factor BamD